MKTLVLACSASIVTAVASVVILNALGIGYAAVVGGGIGGAVGGVVATSLAKRQR